MWTAEAQNDRMIVEQLKQHQVHYGAGYALCIVAWLISWAIAGVNMAIVRVEKSEPLPPPYVRYAF